MRRTIGRLLLPAFLLIAFALPAAAACVPVEFAVAMAGRHGFTSEPVRLTGASLEAAAAFYNAQPPQTDHKITVAIVVARADGEALLLVGADDSICDAVGLTSVQRERIIEKVSGRAS